MQIHRPRPMTATVTKSSPRKQILTLNILWTWSTIPAGGHTTARSPSHRANKEFKSMWLIACYPYQKSTTQISLNFRKSIRRTRSLPRMARKQMLQNLVLAMTTCQRNKHWMRLAATTESRKRSTTIIMCVIWKPITRRRKRRIRRQSCSFSLSFLLLLCLLPLVFGLAHANSLPRPSLLKRWRKTRRWRRAVHPRNTTRLT